MKQKCINATLKRALPPIAALALTTLLILTALPQAGTAAPTVASLSTNPKRINESALGSETAAAHSLTAHPARPPASPLPPAWSGSRWNP